MKPAGCSENKERDRQTKTDRKGRREKNSEISEPSSVSLAVSGRALMHAVFFLFEIANIIYCRLERLVRFATGTVTRGIIIMCYRVHDTSNHIIRITHRCSGLGSSQELHI